MGLLTLFGLFLPLLILDITIFKKWNIKTHARAFIFTQNSVKLSFEIIRREGKFPDIKT